jgi:hypothetical protein
MVYALELQLVGCWLNHGWTLAIVTEVFVVFLIPFKRWASALLSFLPNPSPFGIGTL